MAKKDNPYAICPPRQPMDSSIDEETAKEFALQYRVIPAFEKIMYEHIYKRHYSLKNNANLSCAWLIYKKNFESRVFAPFQFPNERELHFYKNMIRFVPSESVHTRENYRKCLKHGPGVDSKGQWPIPQEAFIKRFVSSAKKGPKVKEKKNSKTKKIAEQKES